MNSVALCLGGGIDSSALVDYYVRKGFRVQGIHVDYGQPSCRGELQAVKRISQHYGICATFWEIVPKIVACPNGEYPGRNVLFVLLAARFLKRGPGLVSLGIHGGTPFYDCSPIFVRDMQHVLDGYFGGRLVLDVPFLRVDKKEVFAYCREWAVPVQLTYSCERNPDTPCGLCKSCLDRGEYDLCT